MRTISTGLYVIFTDGSMYLMRNSGRYLIYALKYLLPTAVFASLVVLAWHEVWWFILANDQKYRHEDSWFAGLITSAITLIILGIVGHEVGRKAERTR